MKAVIMAGGKGTRLRPLTCNKPKPMVPLLNRPVMEYAIDLLKKYGITEIAVTVQYLPEAIKDYFGDGSAFGVSLHYFEEVAPLGTAGSVKNAEEFLDETFIVVSGDGLTDMNLQRAIDFHKSNKAVATLVLTRVEAPLEYGVVITQPDGKITRFLEKPSWGEVFSDTVNTGMYVLEPKIFEYIPRNSVFDFSKDLFPLLMNCDEPLYGYVATGYWCDIGNLTQYRQTQFDMLDGKVDVIITGEEIAPGIWVGNNVNLAGMENVEAPVFLADNCQVEKGAHLGQYTITGENNIIKDGSSIKRTVLWNNNYLGKEAELRGTTLCSNIAVRDNASLFEGSVIGDGCSLGSKSIIKPNVKIWPDKMIEDNTTVHTSLIWGEKVTKNLFGQQGVIGIANVEITPDFISKLAAAYGSTLESGAQIIIGGDTHPFAQLIKKAFVSGLLSAGINTIDLGNTITPVTRFAVKDLSGSGGVHIRFIPPTRENVMLIEFLDANGINIDKGLERKIEGAFVQEDFRRAALNQIGIGRYLPQLGKSYVSNLLSSIKADTIRGNRFKIIAEYEHSHLGSFLPELLEKLDCQVITISPADDSLIDLGKLVGDYQADMGISLDRNGEKLILITRDGQIIKEDLLLAVLALIKFQQQEGAVMAVPVTAPMVMEELARREEGHLVRTKANPRSLMEPTAGDKYQLLFDAVFALVSILEYMAVEELTLSQVVEKIPPFYLEKADVYCSWSDKGTVMRKLIEETMEKDVELVDGIKVYHDNGWTLVLPDSDQPVFRVLSEATSDKVAKELAASYASKIKAFKSRE
ncbi:MAG: sugar phosphate nucleotidyltransferase [Clostridia bacterium]|nr:sugar phosphate nucleotidyltransferase [Clostridia bacterium]